MVSNNIVEALRIISSKVKNNNLNWAIIGSANHAIQGVDVEPRDIDILADLETGKIINDCLKEFTRSNTKYEYVKKERVEAWIGIYDIAGVEIELIAEPYNKNVRGADLWTESENFSAKKIINFQGINLPVINLERELYAYTAINRLEKAKLIRNFLNKKKEFKLICFDMDGVLLDTVNFWLDLHEKYGTLEEGRRLTEKYMETDYKKLVKEVAEKMFKGLNSKSYFELVEEHLQKILPGVKETLKEVHKLGLKTAIITGSTLDVAEKLAYKLDIENVFGNKLVTENDIFTGEFEWKVGSGMNTKHKIIEHLCSKLNIKVDQVIHVGDGLNDIMAFRSVGRGIAFNTQNELVKDAANIIVEGNDLSKIIPYLR